MTTDERALLAAVCADPASDLPRLVYADWLDDHGRPERAEFIRLQCQLATATAADVDPFEGRLRTLAVRERLGVLSVQHYADCFDRPGDIYGVEWGAVRSRGFVSSAVVRMDDFHDQGEPRPLADLYAEAPVSRLECHYSFAAAVASLLADPCLKRLSELTLLPISRPRGERAEVVAELLAEQPWSPNLGTLTLGQGFARSGLGPLAAVPPGRPFPVLDLRPLGPVLGAIRQRLTARHGSRVRFA